MTDELRPGEITVDLPGLFDAGLWFIGRIHTPWTERKDCPRRGDAEAGPLCEIELDPRWLPALDGVAKKPQLQVLYWMDRARRDVVRQTRHGHEDPTGTFALRSPVRPNPIASSVVRLISVRGNRLQVRGLDCLDGTPLIDLKPDIDIPAR